MTPVIIGLTLILAAPAPQTVSAEKLKPALKKTTTATELVQTDTAGVKANAQQTTTTQQKTPDTSAQQALNLPAGSRQASTTANVEKKQKTQKGGPYDSAATRTELQSEKAQPKKQMSTDAQRDSQRSNKGAGAGAADNGSRTDGDRLDDAEYGTEDESNAAPTKAGGDAVAKSAIAEQPIQPQTLLAAVDLLLTVLLISALIATKTRVNKALKIDRGRLDRLEKNDLATRNEIALLRSRPDQSRNQERGIAAGTSAMPKANLQDEQFAYSTFEDLDLIPIRSVPPPRFPVLVADYVSQRLPNSVRVRANAVDGELFSRAPEGEFYLVDDPDGGLYIVPAEHENLTTQYFRAYYHGSYELTSQGSGDLYLIRPAAVAAAGDNWRLSSKGKLEFRAS